MYIELTGLQRAWTYCNLIQPEFRAQDILLISFKDTGFNYE